MVAMRHLWMWPSVLSLDAPLIAVLWQQLFARSQHVRLPLSASVVLALVLWLIYVADRIMDSFQEPSGEEAVRHRFYRAHRGAYGGPFLAVLAATGWLAWRYLRPDVRRDGLVLLGVVAFYFALVHVLPEDKKQWFPKELVVAMVFAIGTCLAVGARVKGTQAAGFVVPLALFALVLWMNALFIEYSEWLQLRKGGSERPHSITIFAGQYFGLCTAVICLGTVAAMASQAFRGDRPVLLAETLSMLGLGLLGWSRTAVPIDLVGLAADVALLTPVLLLPFLNR
jgi:hypothetical protein